VSAGPFSENALLSVGSWSTAERKHSDPWKDELMAKGQKKSNKEARKPKKGSAKPILAKPGTSQVTQVLRDKGAG
jgi:hypothetical protein